MLQSKLPFIKIVTYQNAKDARNRTEGLRGGEETSAEPRGPGCPGTITGKHSLSRSFWDGKQDLTAH